MKTLALFTIFVLIFGTVSTSLVNDAYAQKDPNILLHIATQADKQILNQLDRAYGDSVPSDIQALYEKGHTAVESLESSLPDDMEQARENFLTAMKSFKQITRMISEPITEARLTTSSDVSDRDLKSELNRLHKYFQSLKTVSDNHNTGIDFSEIKELFAQAREQINSGEIETATETIQQLESLIDTTKNNIREHSSNSASDRIIEFALKQLNKIKDILDKATSVDPDMPELEEANSIIQEIETLISEDNISDVKKKFGELNKIVKMIKKSIR
ncbi:MAG TPA: hypothetical protein OQH54_04140 [Nitrosopumilus sp.]|nr:hypothetical protein [Thermoproteota archaeon]HJJ22888.1 hypothetical protein [Nitrosopumilus sp.]